MASDTVTSSAQGHYDQRVEIDFLYLDLGTCSRCLGSNESLREALEAVRPALEATGTQVEVRKTLVESAQQAKVLQFVSSPTIRG
ncbi:MAG TPA: DUF2703 domain-containing protein [bacterium]|nr:DUF2703 domain-containing protein [bacterium]